MRFFITCLVLLLAGCSSTPQKVDVNDSFDKSEGQKTTSSQSTMQQDELLYYLLRKEYSLWQGTPYRLGGNNKRGVDCSALVKNIYSDSLNIKLPRTTETQVDRGYLVYKNQLQVGDLVFFKTGWSTRHVGIYMGKNEFIHASTSKGVITSNLDNVYWKAKYWQARRIID